MKEKIKKLIESESKAIACIPVDDSFEKAIDIMFTRIHQNNGKLITTGMGKAGQIAHNIATTFSSTGTPAAYIHPGEAQHGDLGLIQKNDVLLAISNSGKTHEILDFIRLANKLYDTPFPIITITSDKSVIGELSDCVITTGNPKEICPLGLTPTVSTTVMNVIGNILVTLLMEKINFTKMEYGKRHHGGYLGKKSNAATEK